MTSESGVPVSVYADSINITATPYGVNLTFGLLPAHPPAESAEVEPPTPQALVRMSLEQAKVFAMLLHKNLRSYESKAEIEIALPAGLYEALGIAEQAAGWGDAGASRRHHPGNGCRRLPTQRPLLGIHRCQRGQAES